MSISRKRKRYIPRDGSSGKIWVGAVVVNKLFFYKARAYSHHSYSFRACAFWKFRWICYVQNLCNWFNWSFQSNQLIVPYLTLVISASSNSKMYASFPILITLNLDCRTLKYALLWCSDSFVNYLVMFFIYLNVIHFLHW